jgi:hypothetical protein
MNGDAAYAFFLAFGLLWVGIGAVAVIALLKADNQPIRLGKWGLLVALPIILAFMTALVVARLMA